MNKLFDETDLEIINLLKSNAKMRIHTIASKLHIPSSTVHRRIQMLEKRGIISSWGIKTDPLKLGLTIKAHILIYVDVNALKKAKKTQTDMAKSLSKIQLVESVDIITGDSDILVTLRCKDVQELQKILLSKIQSIEGVSKTKTLLVIG
jgi:Lrp/AsnC family transcriptional regulator, regulator for asnA, asnC and gidA